MRERTGAGLQARRSHAGFTLVEILMVVTVLAIAVSGAAAAIVTGMDLGRVTEETSLAQQASWRILEELQSGTFEETFASYNSDRADDPLGPGTAPGKDFAVRGLAAQAADADGFVGEVLFPTAVVGGALQLREDLVDAELGLPADLDADGAFGDAADHSDDYRLLPVRVRLRWRGATGDRELELHTVLSER